jgi:hypothetical protein
MALTTDSLRSIIDATIGPEANAYIDALLARQLLQADDTPLTHVTAMFLLLRGGTRPLARAMAKTDNAAAETVRRWRNMATLADNTAYLRRMAAFARDGLRQMGRRVMTERGPSGDR